MPQSCIYHTLAAVVMCMYGLFEVAPKKMLGKPPAPGGPAKHAGRPRHNIRAAACPCVLDLQHLRAGWGGLHFFFFLINLRFLKRSRAKGNCVRYIR